MTSTGNAKLTNTAKGCIVTNAERTRSTATQMGSAARGWSVSTAIVRRACQLGCLERIAIRLRIVEVKFPMFMFCHVLCVVKFPMPSFSHA